jgi:hypothetical protein
LSFRFYQYGLFISYGYTDSESEMRRWPMMIGDQVSKDGQGKIGAPAWTPAPRKTNDYKGSDGLTRIGDPVWIGG